ncbi:MAG: phosphatidylinositol mannoside acyltransferase [Egibacteraceae bacterium]
MRVNAALWDLAWETARRLPEALAHALAAVLATVAFWVAAPVRRRLTANLARVVEPSVLDRTVRAAFRSYARYWIEAFRAADLDPDDLDRRTTTGGFAHLDEVLERGRGAIILLAHHGSWDVSAQWGESHGYHMAAVAEVVRPRALFEKFVRLREAVGLEVVPLRRGGDVLGRLEEVLAENHLVGLLAERDLSGRGPVVRFFGEDARIPPGPVVLSQRTGAAIVPSTMLQRPGRRWHIEVLPPVDAAHLDVDEAAQQVACALETLIRLAPEQWHAVQPVWLADVPPHRRGDWTPRAGNRHAPADGNQAGPGGGAAAGPREQAG